MDEEDLDLKLQVFFDRILAEKNDYEEMEYCSYHMKWLLQQVEKYALGTILLVEKTPVLRLFRRPKE